MNVFNVHKWTWPCYIDWIIYFFFFSVLWTSSSTADQNMQTNFQNVNDITSPRFLLLLSLGAIYRNSNLISGKICCFKIVWILTFSCLVEWLIMDKKKIITTNQFIIHSKSNDSPKLPENIWHFFVYILLQRVKIQFKKNSNLNRLNHWNVFYWNHFCSFLYTFRRFN